MLKDFYRDPGAQSVLTLFGIGAGAVIGAITLLATTDGTLLSAISLTLILFGFGLVAVSFIGGKQLLVEHSTKPGGKLKLRLPFVIERPIPEVESAPQTPPPPVEAPKPASEVITAHWNSETHLASVHIQNRSSYRTFTMEVREVQGLSYTFGILGSGQHLPTPYQATPLPPATTVGLAPGALGGFLIAGVSKRVYIDHSTHPFLPELPLMMTAAQVEAQKRVQMEPSYVQLPVGEKKDYRTVRIFRAGLPAMDFEVSQEHGKVTFEVTIMSDDGEFFEKRLTLTNEYPYFSMIDIKF